MTIEIARALCVDSAAAPDTAFVSFRQRLLRNKLSIAAFCAIVLLVVITILAPWITLFDPNELDANAVLQPPSLDHVLGTDEYGRDLVRLGLGNGHLHSPRGDHVAKPPVAIDARARRRFLLDGHGRARDNIPPFYTRDIRG